MMSPEPQAEQHSRDRNPYSAAHPRQHTGRQVNLLRLLGQASRGGLRLAVVVAANVAGIFAFVGALFSSLDLWWTGVWAAAAVGGVTWFTDTIWLFLRQVFSQRSTV